MVFVLYRYDLIPETLLKSKKQKTKINLEKHKKRDK